MKQSKYELSIPDWIEHEMQNWARWCWSGESPWPKPVRGASAECRYYIAPNWGEAAVRMPQPNAEHAQVVQSAYDAMPKPERRVVNAEYIKPWESGRSQYGLAGAARRLQISLNAYETLLRCACFKVEKAFGR